jgi:hypothetical protein
VILLLPSKPQPVEVQRLAADQAPDLGHGQARKLA